MKLNELYDHHIDSTCFGVYTYASEPNIITWMPKE